MTDHIGQALDEAVHIIEGAHLGPHNPGIVQTATTVLQQYLDVLDPAEIDALATAGDDSVEQAGLPVEFSQSWRDDQRATAVTLGFLARLAAELQQRGIAVRLGRES